MAEPVTIPPRPSDLRRRVIETTTKPIDESTREAILAKATISDFLSDTWLWVYFITFIAISLILLFVYMVKNKAAGYAAVVKPTWIPNVYISGIILFIVYFLYFIGSYRAIRLTTRTGDKRRWIIHITFFLTMAMQLVIGWLALYNLKFQWCFWLSWLPPIILAFQMFFVWFIDKIGFVLMVPALILQLIMIFAFYRFWKDN